MIMRCMGEPHGQHKKTRSCAAGTFARPVSHGPLSYDEKAGELISKEAGLAFPVRDGIPIMLAEEARKLSD